MEAKLIKYVWGIQGIMKPESGEDSDSDRFYLASEVDDTVESLKSENAELTKSLVLALGTVEGACGGLDALFTNWLKEAGVSDSVIEEYHNLKL